MVIKKGGSGFNRSLLFLRCHLAGALRPDTTFDGFGDREFTATATALAFVQEIESCLDKRFGVAFPHQLEGTIEKPHRKSFAIHARLGGSPHLPIFWVQDAQIGVVAVVIRACQQANKVGIIEAIGAFLEAHLEGVMPL